jgi:hypothetical protein
MNIFSTIESFVFYKFFKKTTRELAQNLQCNISINYEKIDSNRLPVECLKNFLTCIQEAPLLTELTEKNVWDSFGSEDQAIEGYQIIAR